LSEKSGFLTQRELEIAKLKTKGLMNLEIAKKLNVSPVYVSQTLAGIMAKITKVEDSIKLLEQLDLVEDGTRFRLSPKAKSLVGARRVSKKLTSPITFEKPQNMDTSLIGRIHGKPVDLQIPQINSPDLAIYGYSPISETLVASNQIKFQLRQTQRLCNQNRRWETDVCIELNPKIGGAE
jgi:hypothetical protein